MSVSKLCDDFPCGVFFDSNHVYVIDLQKEKVVVKGSRSNGLYTLKNTENAVFFSSHQATTSEDVWHLRLEMLTPMFFNT